MNSAEALSADGDLFEFRALAEARNYRRALIGAFRPWLRGNVLEVGAGIGQLTMELLQVNGVEHVVALEPNEQFVRHIPDNLPRLQAAGGTAFSLRSSLLWDAIVSVNVLEHIEADELELGRYAELLRPRKGSLCLFVPARPELYAPIDKAFGHFRRYTKPELQRKLLRAGFTIQTLEYANLIGYFAWWFTFKLRGQRTMTPRAVKLFDRCIFPVSSRVESKFGPPPFGQSLIAVATAM
jgi:SAM-dependent methyltransferase